MIKNISQKINKSIKIFFKNYKVKQIIFKNVFWLGLAEAITRLLKLVLIIYVARILGVADYGKFVFALSFVSLFVIFSDFSLPVITNREVSQGKKEEYPTILTLKIILSFFAFFLIIIGSFFITKDVLIQKTILILGLFVLICNFSDIIFAFFKAILKMKYEAIARIFQSILITVSGFYVIFNFPSIENLSYSYLFSAFFSFIFVLIFFHFKIYPLNLSWNIRIWQKYLKFSLPLFLNRIVNAIFYYSPFLIMGFLKNFNSTGFYGASFKLMGAFVIPANLISHSFFPLLSKTSKESREKFQEILNLQIKIMILFSFFLIILGIIFGHQIIKFIYGPDFLPASLSFSFLVIMTVIIVLTIPFLQVLIIFNQQKKILLVNIFKTIIALILNVFLFYKFSFYGLAFSLSLSSFLTLPLFLKLAKKYI